MSKINLKKLIVSQLAKKIPVFHGTHTFTDVFTGRYPKPVYSNPHLHIFL